VPVIVDYAQVLARMAATGFRCNYHNSGAFGFAGNIDVHVRAWIGPEDATIKPSLLPNVRTIAPPFAANLAQNFLRVWRQALPGKVWLMPMSHWHFELHDGSREWLPALLPQIGVDPALLIDRADASPLEFSPDESAALSPLLIALLENLKLSDFQMAFPDHLALCMIHHHTQLWWQTTDAGLMRKIDAAFVESGITDTAR
jgi:hypothetical protein